MHCIKSQRQVWTWCSCYLSRRFTQSKLDSCFFLCATLGRLGFWQLFGPHWHERLESLSRWKPGWPSWHFTKQIRQEVLTIRNDIADPSCICLRQTTSCTCSVSTQQHGRSVVSGQEFYSLFLDINVTTFTYINIVHKTRNSNLHPRNSWQTTSQYYFPVHTTWHYTACTQYYFALQFPVLLCTTKLAQSTPQYYFVLQSLHQVVSSTLQFAAPKPDLDAKARKRRFWSIF